MKHRGLLHHQVLVVSDLAKSSGFYGPVFSFLGYACVAKTDRFEDWKRWDLDTPHELSIVEAERDKVSVPHMRGAVGHHHHMAFAAADSRDVDRFHREVLIPLEARGLCRVLDPPAACPEYGESYYATFFEDPDGLRFEFVINKEHFDRKKMREAGNA